MKSVRGRRANTSEADVSFTSREAPVPSGSGRSPDRHWAHRESLWGRYVPPRQPEVGKGNDGERSVALASESSRRGAHGTIGSGAEVRPPPLTASALLLLR